MVSDFPTVESRLQHIMEACQYPSPAQLMAAIGERPQQWRNWTLRDSFGRAHKKIKAATGASIDWLTTGEGEPFPSGPIPYAGPVPAGSEPLARIAQLERDVGDLWRIIAMGLTRFSAMTPDAGAAVAADLRAYLAQPGTPSEALPDLLKLLEAAGQQTAPVAPDKKQKRPK